MTTRSRDFMEKSNGKEEDAADTPVGGLTGRPLRPESQKGTSLDLETLEKFTDLIEEQLGGPSAEPPSLSRHSDALEQLLLNDPDLPKEMMVLEYALGVAREEASKVEAEPGVSVAIDPLEVAHRAVYLLFKRAAEIKPPPSAWLRAFIRGRVRELVNFERGRKGTKLHPAKSGTRRSEPVSH